MARKKARMTGCGKLILVLIILAPLAYFGAAYYNGEDPIQSFKDLIGIESSSEESSSDEKTKAISTPVTTDNEGAADQSDEVESLKKQLKSALDENTTLKEKVEDLEQEVLRLKNELQNE